MKDDEDENPTSMQGDMKNVYVTFTVSKIRVNWCDARGVPRRTAHVKRGADMLSNTRSMRAME